MSTRRAPSGLCGGALAGQYPDEVAFGLPNLMGLAWYDDFCAYNVSGRYGEKRWQLYAPGTGTTTSPGVTTAHEFGLQQCTVTVSGDTSALVQNGSLEPIYRMVPVGSLFAVKIKHYTSTADSVIWAGFSENYIAPAGAVFVDFVGVRNEGGNWYGVCRDGNTETTVDLGLAASTSSSAYRVMGFFHANDGVRFFTADVTDRQVPPFITWFSPITTNHPNEDLSPIIGITSSAVGTKGFTADFFNFGGRTTRG